MASNPTDLKRRKFLLSAGVGGAAAVAGGTALLQTGAVAPVPKYPKAHPKVHPNAHSLSDSGYQASEHVRSYYRTARV